MKLFITGGTGFLGRSLVKQLAPQLKKIYVLVRKGSLARSHKIFKDYANVEIVCGDITHPNIITDEKKLKEVCTEVESIFHLAGMCDPDAAYRDCLVANVAGTQNMLSFSGLFKKLRVFHYMSTISVCGNYSGTLKEEELELGQEFNNHYEKTKYDAEILVRNWAFSHQIFTRIYRPGILIGVGGPGKEVPKFNDGPYYFFEILSKLKSKKLLLNTLKYLPLPFDKKSHLPIIPLEDCVDILSKSILKKQTGRKIKCYHLLADDCPTVQEFMQDSFDTFGFSVSVIPLPPSKVNHVIMDKVGFPKDFSKSMSSQCLFDQENLKKDFPRLNKTAYHHFKENNFKTVVANF